jgi:hypothetical protein
MSHPFFRKNVENFDLYMPEVKSLGDHLTLNIEMLLRIETNLKLNLIDRKGKSLLPDINEEEVHFVKFEAIISTYELQLSTLWRMIKESRSKMDL